MDCLTCLSCLWTVSSIKTMIKILFYNYESNRSYKLETDHRDKFLLYSPYKITELGSYIQNKVQHLMT